VRGFASAIDLASELVWKVFAFEPTAEESAR
jgi:hypothetical protein